MHFEIRNLVHCESVVLAPRPLSLFLQLDQKLAADATHEMMKTFESESMPATADADSDVCLSGQYALSIHHVGLLFVDVVMYTVFVSS